MLYEQGILHLRIESGIRYPFPYPVLRDVGVVIERPHYEGDKFYKETQRRFRCVGVTWLLGGLRDGPGQVDFSDVMYHGGEIGYTSEEMMAGWKGLRQVLGALNDGQEAGKERVEAGPLGRATVALRLAWPEDVKRATAAELDGLWEAEGIWPMLKELGKRRNIMIKGPRKSDGDIDGESTMHEILALCMSRVPGAKEAWIGVSSQAYLGGGDAGPVKHRRSSTCCR